MMSAPVTFATAEKTLRAARIPGVRVRTDGRISISRSDGRRLDISPTFRDGLLVEVELSTLPESAMERERFITRALTYSVVKMPLRHDILCFARDGQSLVLQCQPADLAASSNLLRVIHNFMEVVDDWIDALQIGTGGSAGGRQ